MKVVADASPLIALAKIDEFPLLQKLFSQLIITPEVYAEVVVTGAGRAGAADVSTAEWIEVRQMARPVDLRAAQERIGLDLGELSALTLAKEIQADLILLDDLAARRIAQREGLRVQGTVGILEACFVRGHLRDLRGSYQELLNRGVYLDRAFLNTRLESLKLRPL